METPDLSLNSTFSVPDFEDQEADYSSSAMCKYTIYSYDCGHPAEDHVDSRACSEYQRTGVHCDRDNPANKDRIWVKNKDRNGICDKCLHKGGEKDETEAMLSEMDKAREQDLIESRAHEEEMRRAEQQAREASLAEAQRLEAAHEARIRAIERESAEEYNRKMRQQEEDDFDFMMRKSRAEAERAAHEKEMELIQRAFFESLKTDPSVRNYEDEVISSGVNDLGGGLVEKWIEVTTTSRETLLKQTSAPIPPPPPPPPPPVAIAPKPVHKASQPLSVGKTTPKTVDYTMPAIGDQNIGRFTVGTRHMPIHPSQEIKAPATPKSPMTPSSPAPFARLGSTIAPDIPALREARGPSIPVPSVLDARAGLRRTTGPSRQLPPRDEPYVDPKLKAAMAKRRQWEEDADDAASSVFSTSITPSQSASNIPSQGNSPTASNVGGLSRVLPVSAETIASMTIGATEEEACGDDDIQTIRAKRISKLDFDKNRKSGWGGA